MHVFWLILAGAIVAQAGPLHVGLLQRIRADANGAQYEHARVLVELFVMSRCPDALKAETRFQEVFATVHPIVNIQLHYIANLAGDTVQCKHGEQECAGNQQQLCVAKYSKGKDKYDTLWRFVQCQNQKFGDIGSSELAESCLKQLPSDMVKVNRVRTCWSGHEGENLLLEDVRHTRKLGVQKSCTIFVAGKQRCVEDGGQWYDCEGGSEVDDFVATICEAYEAQTGTWSELCGERPSRLTIPAGDSKNKVYGQMQ